MSSNDDLIDWPCLAPSDRSAWRRWQTVITGMVAGLALCLILWSRLMPIPARADLSMDFIWVGREAMETRSVAWGDWDGDGDLDLAVGNNGYVNQVFENDGRSFNVAWESTGDERNTHSVAWGDWDGDGDLDLAIGNWNDANQVYENGGGSLSLAWESGDERNTHSVAWGDWDGDGDLDLAVGNSGVNQVYENGGGSLSLAWESIGYEGDTRSLAWGDWDGDGDLDLAAGNSGLNQVFENGGGSLSLEWESIGYEGDTRSLVWGDWDGDGDLDLAVGNSGVNQVFENGGGGLSLAWESTGHEEETYSVAWGDWDGDGDLDLAVGNSNHANRVYENGGGSLSLAWASTAEDQPGTEEDTRSLAWGDRDGDGDLDLAAGNYGVNQIFENDGVSLRQTWESTGDENSTYSVAWGDWDGDGDLDLAVGNWYDVNQVYENDGGGLSLAWESTGDASQTNSVAWGDWDGDGDLDLAVGNWGVNQVYENDGGGLSLAWESTGDSKITTSVAWGDWDGDGDLDLAAGNGHYHQGIVNQVYENDGGSLSLTWESTGDRKETWSVAWGDWDGDGDLDLAVGNSGVNQVYENDGGSLSLAWESAGDEKSTYSVAWGDWDGDGDLDLAAGNWYDVNQVYENEAGSLSLAWESIGDIRQTNSVAWGDWNGDGELDLTVGNWGVNQVYGNEGGSLGLAWESADDETDTRSVAWGDWDGDGDLDMATGNYGVNRVFENARQGGQALPNNAPFLGVRAPGVTASADFYASAAILDEPTIPIPYTLFDREGDPVGWVKAFYSLDGGGHWLPAVATPDTIVSNVSASPMGSTHTYTWDTFASGVFGQSDDVVFRLVAYHQPAESSDPGEYVYTHSMPGPYQWPYATATTFPFRVRGTQIRVYSESVSLGNEVAGALVYRLPGGQSAGADPLMDPSGRPLQTDHLGYLQGRGEIDIGDQLVALLPVASTDSYTLSYTSATPTLTGLEARTVVAPGVQILTVSSDNPLLLFDLDVSLEWDARRDRAFLEQLQFNLLRASELLYDWTNGQAALGEVTITHDRQYWNDAHIRIYATNRMRPSAAQGGVVSQVITDPLESGIVYVPGQVRMGSVWNRYGESDGTLEEDWARALAHELGHYVFFLDDNYLGLDEDGLLMPVDTCTGTAMSDPYRDDYGEFHPEDDWLPDCERTLSHQSTGRSDWRTITTFYAGLDGTLTNPGPTGLPLEVTQIEIVEPITPSTSLQVPVFYLRMAGAGRYQPGDSARAFLFQGDRLTDLGHPTVDHVLARGARPGDRVCVYELAAGRLGCETVTAGDEQIELVSLPSWQPEVTVTPVTSRTITISVTNVPVGLPLRTRLFPTSDPAPPVIALSPTGTGAYAGTFTLAEPAPEGYVHVWADEAQPRREIVTDYALGGNPAYRRGRFAYRRGRFAYRRGRFAPAVSSDGQVVVFGTDLNDEDEWFFTLQEATTIPSLPSWVTVVGQAYQLSASADAPDLSDMSISFNYLGSEVPPGEEDWLRVTYWDGASWQQLPTRLDTYHNLASAPAQGSGLYALMSSIEIPLYGLGWNNFAYPVRETRPVTVALQSIEGYFATVYGYDGTDQADPWKVYDVTDVPEWVNDLDVLEFGRGYWISVTQPITLYLKGASNSTLGAPSARSVHSPPATYYGDVWSGPGFTPAPGMAVAAWVDGNPCGQGEIVEVDDRLVYSVNVFADGPGGTAGCGVPGRVVSFEVEAELMASTAVWNNDRLRELTLSLASRRRIYLPLIRRRQ